MKMSRAFSVLEQIESDAQIQDEETAEIMDKTLAVLLTTSIIIAASGLPILRREARRMLEVAGELDSTDLEGVELDHVYPHPVLNPSDDDPLRDYRKFAEYLRGGIVESMEAEKEEV